MYIHFFSFPLAAAAAVTKKMYFSSYYNNSLALLQQSNPEKTKNLNEKLFISTVGFTDKNIIKFFFPLYNQK